MDKNKEGKYTKLSSVNTLNVLLILYELEKKNTNIIITQIADKFNIPLQDRTGIKLLQLYCDEVFSRITNSKELPLRRAPKLALTIRDKCRMLWESESNQEALEDAMTRYQLTPYGKIRNMQASHQSIIIMNMYLSDYYEIQRRLISPVGEIPFGRLIGNLHTLMEGMNRDEYFVFYLSQTIYRYGIYNIIQSNKIDVAQFEEDYEGSYSTIADELLYRVSNWWENSDKVILTDIMTSGRQAISLLTALGGITTVSDYGEYYTALVENAIIHKSDRIPSQCLINGAASECYKGIASIKYAQVIDSKIRRDSLYWKNIITEKGYKINVKGTVYGFFSILIVIYVVAACIGVLFDQTFASHNIDYTSYLNYIFILEALAIILFQTLYQDNWTYFDMARGYVYVKQWHQLPDKYKNPNALADMVAFLLWDSECAANMDPMTNCYLYGIAVGSLIGPRPIESDLLLRAGVMIMDVSSNSIALITPHSDTTAKQVALRANLTANNYYHVDSTVKMANFMTLITKIIQIG